MTAYEIGTKLVELCNKGQNMEVINTYYADTITSVEAAENPGNPDMPRTMQGIETIKKKNEWWYDNHEVHSGSMTGPFPHGDDKFAVFFNYDVTFKPANQRMKMEEIGVYTVENGKITKEEFFYHMG